ncbi:hypothetical protein HPB50_002903 [Hyalomma asiaticum]|uniref:Uncharacterized protein n=1 Tax=Hyalomma asiaticum TaxID=266040 RepID=A0ACB7TE56_HYAAI|nr:hypothetical protein HPB50_002903 [Hyalomma asiaticum]
MVSSAHGRLLSLRGWAPDGEDDVPPCTVVAVEHLPPPPAREKSALAALLSCDRNWLLKALTTIAVLGGLVLTLLWGKLYVRECLVWLDSQDSETVCLVFVLMYTLVAFPLTWGYILLNFACGYHFGLVLGVAVTAAAASVGISVAHTVMKRFFLGFIMARLLSSEVVRSTLALLDTGHAFKVVIISRLTPIPFGLQNAMFAVSLNRAAYYAKPRRTEPRAKLSSFLQSIAQKKKERKKEGTVRNPHDNGKRDARLNFRESDGATAPPLK